MEPKRCVVAAQPQVCGRGHYQRTKIKQLVFQSQARRGRPAREMEELKREHNELLLGALRTHNARALTTATKAVRRELCLLVHPDKASRFASARLMGEAVMQRLGELAQ